MGTMAQIFAKSQIKNGVKKMELAQKSDGENSDSLFQQAYSKFELVIENDSTVVDAVHKWALALTAQASGKTGQDAENVFSEANAKYAAAVTIAPNNHEILNDWGACLMDQARVINPDPANGLYDQANEKFLAAEKLCPGISAYNLACISSIRNDSEQCQAFLKTAFEHANLPQTEDIKKDPDLSNFAQAEWFEDFIDSIPKI